MTQRDDIRPWDRQPGETSKAYALFQVFLDQGQDRVLRRVAEEVSKSQQYIRRLSTQHNWQSRSAAWDSMPRRAVNEAYEEMAARVAAQHERLATKLTERLEKNLELLPEGADPSIKWSTAHGAARQGHAFAADLSKPKAEIQDQISTAIARLVQQLTEE